MLVKDRYLEKFNKFFFLLLVFLVSKNVIANSTKIELLNYNKSLDSSSASFIQSDGITIQEGEVFVGHKRIKIVYTAPQKITIVVSENKGMYVNHELMETQYFNTNKSFIKIFFQLFTGVNFFEQSTIDVSNDIILIENNIEVSDSIYDIKIIYENNPIKLRKVRFTENNQSFEIGLYNYSDANNLSKEFFSLINPYLIN